jgi:beta-D-galactosyl-(1->4)-L-rhamnose phosphorylase
LATRSPVAPHFITADVTGPLDLGKDTDGIHVFGPDTTVLADREGSPRLAVHRFGRGRAVYLSGFKFTFENTRLLHRALFWAAGRDPAWGVWQSANVRTEATWFAKAGKLVVINNAGSDEATTVTLADGRAAREVTVPAHGIQILDV